jgi:phosphoribosylaminoimidazole-succinocarboxamide synthase
VSTLADLPLIASGKVREMYDLGGRGRRAADGRQRPHLHLRRGPPDADPDKGKVLTGLSVFWFEKTEGTSSPTT